MADHEIASGGSSDDVARLIALTERQHQLWIMLREAEDEGARNEVFDELTANRREIAALREKADARGEELPELPSPRQAPEPQQPPRSVGEQLRKQIITRPGGVAPPQPPPPPAPPPLVIDIPTAGTESQEDPPAISEPASPEIDGKPIEDAAPKSDSDPPDRAREPIEFVVLGAKERKPREPQPSVPEETAAEDEGPKPEPTDELQPEADRTQLDESEGVEDTVETPDLAPEAKPYRSRADDLAALRRELAAKEKRGPKAGDEAAKKRREAPKKRRGASKKRGRAASDSTETTDPAASRKSRVFPVIAILVAIGSVAVAVWYSFFFDQRPVAAPQANVTTTSTTTTTAPAVPLEDAVLEIQGAIDALEVGRVGVTSQVGTIVLSGFVNTELDREDVIGTAQALAGGRPVDSSRLNLTPPDDELNAAVTEALVGDEFAGIEASTYEGVVVLTGTIGAADRTDLMAAAAAVGGVLRVVDATTTRNLATELAAELRRIGGPDPLVYESGQLDLTAAQLATLDEMAEAILARPGPYVTVVGYTDPAGAAEENRQISQVRADLVRNYLVAQGIPSDRVLADGRGEDVPVGVVLPVGLERRVEFEIGYAAPPGVTANFRIGIVAPSARNDRAFTQSIVQAADLFAAEGEIVGIDISDETSGEAAADALRSYAESGYDLIIAHGAEYGDAVGIVAAEFPGIAFVWGPVSDAVDLPNVSTYGVAAEEGAYVMGAVAASLTESGVVGIVGSMESGDSRLFVEGFAAGVAATDSDVEVLTAYTGSTSDATLGANEATVHIAAGADVLAGTDATAAGAIAVAAENNAVWFGSQVDQSAWAEDIVVASQVYHWEVALREIVSGFDQGAPGGQVYTLTLGNGGLAIAYNPAYPLAPDAIIAADAIITEIISGALSVNE